MTAEDIDRVNQDLQDRGFTLWFTGLSGAGKSTIAERVYQHIQESGRKVAILDGDVVRTNLSKGLGFSKEDRDTNIRRIGFVSKRLSRSGAVAIAAAISPYREVREDIGDFVEVFEECSLEELTRSDVKGLYEKAIRGEIKNFTSISDPYEEPLNPELVVNSQHESVEESVAKVMAKLHEVGYLSADIATGGSSPMVGTGRNA